MAFGDLLNTLSGSGTSIPNPADASGSVVVAVGDLVVAVISEQTQISSTGVTDNLGNSYSAQNAGSDAGTATGRMFYSRVTVAGTLTTVHFAVSSGNSNYSLVVGVFAGPFAAPPIDANPANITSDVVSPFTCPATGTLAQASELVVGWGTCGSSSPNDWAGSGITLALQVRDTGGVTMAALGYVAVSSTSSVAPAFTGTAPGQDVLGTASFLAAAAAGVFMTGGMPTIFM